MTAATILTSAVAASSIVLYATLVYIALTEVQGRV